MMSSKLPSANSNGVDIVVLRSPPQQDAQEISPLNSATTIVVIWGIISSTIGPEVDGSEVDTAPTALSYSDMLLTA
jgi:hypothetical protein